MTRLTAPVMCSAISNYEDNDLSTSEYNGSSTLTPSTTYNGMGSNATTISSQSSLSNYGIGDFNQQQSTHLTNSINNDNFNNSDFIHNNNNTYHQHQQHQQQQQPHGNDTPTRQQTANYYGVNDLREASWRKQAITSGAMTCDFYGGAAGSTTNDPSLHYNSDVTNVTTRCRYGSQTSVCNDKLVQPIHSIVPPYNLPLPNNPNIQTSTRTLPNTVGFCSDSLDDVSGVFDQMSIQSELITSSLARHHYDSLDNNNKYFETLSAAESFKPSNVIMDQQNQPSTPLPKPNRMRDSPHLTRTYSMIGQSRRGHVDLDKSMTLNRHERRFITRNIASVLSKPRPPPTIPSIPQLTQNNTSSPLNQHDKDYIRDRLATHSYQDYQPNTSQDAYADARDSSFLSCASQPVNLDDSLSDSTSQKKKHNGGALANLGSRITLATKGKTMQSQIANLKKFFSSAPKRKSFIGGDKKSSLFDTTDGDIFLNKRCPSAEALTNGGTIKPVPPSNLDRSSVFSSCSVKEDSFDYKSYTPAPYSNSSMEVSDRTPLNSNSARLNYIKELHRQSGEFVVSQNNRKLTTLFEEQPRKYPPPPNFRGEFTYTNTSLSQFDSTAKSPYQPASLSFMNGSSVSDRPEENCIPADKVGDHNLSSELDADTTLVSNVFDSSYEKKENQKLANKVAELELKLQSKEKSCTDLQLEQLSAAYMIDQLRSTIEKLEQENSHLKATLSRYHHLQPGNAGFNGSLRINQG